MIAPLLFPEMRQSSEAPLPLKYLFCGPDKNKIAFGVSQQAAYLYNTTSPCCPSNSKKISSVYSSKTNVINNINSNNNNNNNNLLCKWLKSVPVTILYGSYIAHLMLSKHRRQDQNQKKLGKSTSPPSCNSSIHPCLGGQVGKETETSKVLQAAGLKADLPLHPPQSIV